MIAPGNERGQRGQRGALGGQAHQDAATAHFNPMNTNGLQLKAAWSISVLLCWCPGGGRLRAAEISTELEPGQGRSRGPFRR